jgi:hypothetical protein
LFIYGIVARPRGNGRRLPSWGKALCWGSHICFYSAHFENFFYLSGAS